MKTILFRKRVSICSANIRFLIIALILTSFLSCSKEKVVFRKISSKDYLDKVKAAWVGQMAGVGWGGPTEWLSIGQIISKDKIPVWTPSLINQYNQDDIYVEMTFLQSLERYGMDVTNHQIGIDFANSIYDLAGANDAARENLRNGIAPPESGHPANNFHCNDIDYQIESDFSGIISPGMPDRVIELGNKFGHIMSYGEGVYAGQFIGGMYSAAFFEHDILKIINYGLKCIPQQCDYAKCVRDVIRWYSEDTVNWQKTWKLIENKYRIGKKYQKYGASDSKVWVDIDAKLNGAYILLGLLYGRSNPDSTIVISMRAGRDSDCNPSNAAGILFTTYGFSRLPQQFTSALDTGSMFFGSNYDISRLSVLCEKLTRDNLYKIGGKVETDSTGTEYLYIPEKKISLNGYEESYHPGPIDEANRFGNKEMEMIRVNPECAFRSIIDSVAPGWRIRNSSKNIIPCLTEFIGKRNCLAIEPPSEVSHYIIEKRPDIPLKKKTTLKFLVSNEKNNDWILNICINWSVKERIVINDEFCKGGWKEIDFDLSQYHGVQKLPIWLEGEKGTSVISRNFWKDIDIKSE
jgi:hypothetical protein